LAAAVVCFLAAANRGGEHTTTNPQFLTIEHPSPFILDRNIVGKRPWGHLFEIEKVAGGLIPAD
jgi:hypothetical protein